MLRASCDSHVTWLFLREVTGTLLRQNRCMMGNVSVRQTVNVTQDDVINSLRLEPIAAPEKAPAAEAHG